MDKSELQALCEARLSTRAIAAKRACSQATARYWLKKHGLKTLPGVSEHLCATCGETEPSKFYGTKTLSCKKCHNTYKVISYRQQAARIREYMGGKCYLCGYEKHQSALDVHHLDPTTKEGGYGNRKRWKWSRVVQELKVCILLCKCCHSAFHNGELSPEDARKCVLV